MKRALNYGQVLEKKKEIESGFRSNLNIEATHSATKMKRAIASRETRYSVSQ